MGIAEINWPEGCSAIPSCFVLAYLIETESTCFTGHSIC